MSSIHLAGIDLAVVILYFVAVMVAGLSFLRHERSAESYFLAGRTLTLPAFVATLVSTWYGGILGIGEYAYTSGLSSWLVLGVPYYLFALVFALWLAPRIRAAELYTIPDKIAEAYGRPAGIIGGLFAYGMTNPAPYALMLAVLIQLVFGWALLPAMLVGVVLSTIYVYVGGFRSDVRVNILQFVLMFLGFAIILPYCATRLGGLGWLRDQLLAQDLGQHLTWNGGQNAQYVAAWFFIALWTMVDPGFHQRCYAARDGRTARNGILVSILFWAVFDAMTNTAGLYARAALPGIDPTMAFPLLADRLLPPVALGIFYVGMLATVMSTLVSYTFLCGVTFARDIVWRLRGGDEQTATRWTAPGLVLTSLMAIILALKLPSVVKLWYVIGTVFVPGLLLPLLTSYSERWRIPARLAQTAMILASAVSLGWVIWGATHQQDGWPVYPLGLEPMYPGLLTSLLLFAIGWALPRRPRPASTS
ncbi:MAG: sodium:solute symporter family protein [Armatimonadetes bacterium]|nr:sodium:solute symporter family protein [Armatimonadota bacterium]